MLGRNQQNSVNQLSFNSKLSIFFKLGKVAQGHTATGWSRIQTHPQERSVMKHKTRTQQILLST